MTMEDDGDNEEFSLDSHAIHYIDQVDLSERGV
jgi:hypothetical protein